MVDKFLSESEIILRRGVKGHEIARILDRLRSELIDSNVKIESHILSHLNLKRKIMVRRSDNSPA